MATFTQLDKEIREAMKDVPERRRILTMLHDIEEGLNQCHGFFLKVTGHNLKDGGWFKEEHTTFQVNTG